MFNLITTALNMFLVLYCLVMGVWALFDSSISLPPPALVWVACALAYAKGKG
jgi:hypothetical protein